MTRRSGRADLPLRGGHVPSWLSARMARLGALICQAIAAITDAMNCCDVYSPATNRVRKSAATSVIAQAVLLGRWVERATMRRVDLPHALSFSHQ